MPILTLFARVISSTILLASMLTFSAYAADEMAEFKAAIQKLYDMKVEAFANDDADTIARKFYAPDARSVSANDAHTYRGTEEFLKVYEEVVPTATVRVESVETYLNGTAGWDWANFHVTPTVEGEEPFTFMILFLWAKENGVWSCKGDFYTLGKFDTSTASH